MADRKISQLTDGGAPQATDEFVVDRAGTDNFKLDFASIKAAAEATVASDLAAHIADPSGAHAASAISNVPAGIISATDVQAAIDELAGEIPASLAGAVILAPASSARNVIQPTGGAVIAAILKAHAAQSVNLLEFQTSAGSVLLAVDQLGRVTSGAAVGAAVAEFDLNPTYAPVSATDVYGSTIPLALGLRMILDGTLSANTPTAQFQGLQAVMKGPTSDKTMGILFGADIAAIHRGTKALAGAQQLSSIIGLRAAALDYDYTATGDDATGTVYSILGMEPYASHGGQPSVNNIIAVAAYAEAQQLLGVTPGPVAGFITGVNSLIATDTSIGTLPAMYGFSADRTHFANTAITLAAAYYATNYGQTGTVDSYGLYIAAQSGSTNPYGIYVAGGKNVFVDGILINQTSAPADAYYANSQGGWWWDQANSLAKWKGKTAGGTVVNLSPYVVGGTDVALADGGTGASLADPNADRIMFWDDSAGAVTWLSPGTNLSITGTTLDAAGGGSATTTAVNQSGHGLAVGDVVRVSGASTYAKAQADSAANAEVAGIVSAVADANNFTLTTGGQVTGLSGLTANTVYFLSPSTAGLLTATAPTTASQVSKPVFIAYSTTAGYFHNWRGQVLGDPAISTTGPPQWATRPAGSLYENASRATTSFGDGNLLSSQRLNLAPIWLPGGLTITSITFVSAGTNLGSGVHQIFGLFDGATPLAGGAARALLRATNDDGATAWGTNTVKTLTLTSPYVTPATGFYYLGILVQAGSVPTLQRVDLGNTIVASIAPVLCGTSNTGLTAMPATANAPSAQSSYPYAYVS